MNSVDYACEDPSSPVGEGSIDEEFAAELEREELEELEEDMYHSVYERFLYIPKAFAQATGDIGDEEMIEADDEDTFMDEGGSDADAEAEPDEDEEEEEDYVAPGPLRRGDDGYETGSTTEASDSEAEERLPRSPPPARQPTTRRLYVLHSLRCMN